MEESIGTGDIIIGVLAALGVVVLLVAFVFVVRKILLTKEE
ncbi:MAG: hypothetical protein V3T42_07215 [Nitrospirales bacterium]|jgi:hypothetical protein